MFGVGAGSGLLYGHAAVGVDFDFIFSGFSSGGFDGFHGFSVVRGG